MRFETFELRAYGGFANRTLCFPHQAEDFHLIFGQNEAGKSTTLRAFSDFLFGIPKSTQDDYRFEPSQLRLAATLSDGRGNRQTLVRRKGLKNTLLAGETEAPMDEACLARLLGPGVSREYFEGMFGLNQHRLRRGAEQLLLGSGELSLGLFEAGASVGGVQTLLKALREEQRSLYQPNARNPIINKAHRLFDEANKRATEQRVSEQRWTQCEQALLEARRDCDEVFKALQDCQSRRERLERVRRTLGLLQERRLLEDELLLLSEKPLLPAHFAEQRQSAEQSLRESALTLAFLDDQLTACRLQLSHLPPAEQLDPLLAADTAISSLWQESIALQGALARLPECENALKRCEAERARLLKGLFPEQREDSGLLLPGDAQLARLKALAEEETERAQQDNVLAEKILLEATLLRSGEEALANAPKVPDLALLRDTQEESIRLLACYALDDEIARLEVAHQALQTDCLALPLWERADFEALKTLPLPPEATVIRFRDEMAALRQQRQHLAARRAEHEERIRDTERQLRQLGASGPLPSEEELRLRRQQRDALLDSLAEQASADGSVAQWRALVQAIAETDRMADARFEAADRLAVLEALKRDRATETETLTRLQIEATLLESNWQSLLSDWQALWRATGISPLPPEEMLCWLESVRSLLARAADCQLQGEQIRQHRQERSRLCERFLALSRLYPAATIEKALVDLTTAELAAWVDFSRPWLAQLEADRQSRAQLSMEVSRHREALAGLRAQREHLAQHRETNRQHWQEVLCEAGLPANLEAAQWAATADDLRQLRQLEAERARLLAESQAIRADEQRISLQTQAWIGPLAPELAESSPAQALSELSSRLAQAHRQAADLQRLHAEIERLNRSQDEARLAQASAQALLTRLCEQAGHVPPERLEAVEADSERKRQLTERLGELTHQLLQAGDGLSLSELAAEADGCHADALALELSALSTECETLTQRFQACSAKVGALAQEMETLSAADGSAQAVQEAENHLACMKRAAKAYLRLEIGQKLLALTMTRYREQNQGPLLQRASALFERLTLGQYEALRVDLTDEDRPFLVGVRAEGPLAGRLVPLAGMSEGTCDQVFLALRLAAIEQTLQQRPPLPFIVDDILTSFDDERSAATLQVLQELSRKTQVLFFTHHQRLVEFARPKQLAVTTL
jgi:uncharacterized protein YhaN